MSNGYDKFQLNRDVRNSSQTGNTDEFFGKKKSRIKTNFSSEKQFPHFPPWIMK